MLKSLGNAGGTGGSGTVNNGTSGQIAYYATTGTAVSGETLVSQATMTLVSAPAFPQTQAYTMQGLAATITCSNSGIIVVTISGNVIAIASPGLGGGIQWQIAWGTGTPPANGAAAVGTVVGNNLKNAQSTSSLTSADYFIPFSHTVIFTGTPGTVYWIDEQVQNLTATTGDFGFGSIAVALYSPAL
jgi:hypothetical protein